MSTPLAHYSFLPWLRRGIGNLIAEHDALGVDPIGAMALERANMAVGLTVKSTDIADSSLDENLIEKTFKMLGPPDILAISATAIIHVEPKPKVNNYEANGLPYIEFYEEDFLWAYTPAGVDTGAGAGKLTPWLALICLKDSEFTLGSTSDGRTYVTIANDAIAHVFHDETQHWAWGHVHLNTEMAAATIGAQIAEVTSELAADPDTGLSRLLCPRKLVKETEYTAFLIPAFETGRLAGLSASYTGVYAQQMSWGLGTDYATKTRGYDYPVYYSWKFRTGLYGDFESLARLLAAVVLPPELGKRDMYIADAGYGLDSTTPESTVLGIEGALKPPGFVSDTWTNGPGDEAYRSHLRKLLNLSIDNENQDTLTPAAVADAITLPFYSSGLGEDPIVTPEIFGRWHGLVTRLQQSPNPNYAWVNGLNLDPRNRATAGLGTNVIKKNQEDYMRRAWLQVKQINEANDKIRKAALAGQINSSVFAKHLKPYESATQNGSADKLIRITRGMHSFLKLDTADPSTKITIAQTIKASLVPNASQSASFAKLTRPGKKSNKKLNALGGMGATLLHENVTHNFNLGFIETAALKAAPVVAVNTSLVSNTITAAISTFILDDKAMASEGFFGSLLAETNYNNLFQVGRKTTLKARIDANGDLNPNSKNLAKALVDSISSSVDGTATGDPHTIRCATPQFHAIWDPSVTAKAYLNLVVDIDTGGAGGVIARATSLSDIQAFQTLFNGFSTYQNVQLVGIPELPAIDGPIITALHSNITGALQQKGLMISRIASGITVNVRDPLTQVITQHTIDKLKPIMAYPIYEDPMFRELKAISQEYILPNLKEVPVNSITLLETNQAFIEAYMAGLNHEMSRELLWREFPTDQRGSYFRQFWDVSDDVFQSNPEMKLDIKKMHLWHSALGSHSPRVATNTSGTYLVLLVRGELLKKYPNTQVYAQKAAYTTPGVADTPRTLASDTNPANLKTPVFMAELDPDIYLFGFDLDKAEAQGDSDDVNKPGWFFVLRERPGQIRFGLDDFTPIDPDDPTWPTGDPTTWNDLAWEHLVATADDLKEYQIDVTHALSPVPGTPTATWGKNAADMAFILYQNPVMFCRHAQEMLPD
jgi:hypothetical protein